jgi:hypothetical protein
MEIYVARFLLPVPGYRLRAPYAVRREPGFGAG